MREQALTHEFAGQRVAMVLANDAKSWLISKQVFQPPLVFKEPEQMVAMSKFPRHLASGPKPFISIPQRPIQSAFDPSDHPIDIELPIDQLSLRGENQAGSGNLLGDIYSDSSQTGMHAGYHRRAIQIKTAIVLV